VKCQLQTPTGPRHDQGHEQLGVAEWSLGDSLDSLLARDDAALYRAGEMGRNRVVGADSTLPKQTQSGIVV
jgi:PleD family two-component response regulator